MPEPNEFEAQRLAKLQRLKALGIDPYPARCARTYTTRQAVELLGGASESPNLVSVAGRITALRAMGRATFLDLRDGTGKLQLHIRRDRVGDQAYEVIKELDLGDFLGAGGTMFRTRTGEPTVAVASFTVLAKALLPLPEKWHGLRDAEKRYRQRYLDLIANQEVREVFLLRSRVVSAIRRFLDERGFLEVETPVLVPVAAGAHATPFVTHHEALDRDLYLRIATELYLKRLIIGGFDKVYELGRVFRNEGISFKHNPEFTLLESYEAYASYLDVMRMVEELLAYITQQALGATQVKQGDTVIDFARPWRRVGFRDAVREASGLDIADPQWESVQALRDEMRRLGVKGQLDIQSPAQLYDKLVSHFVEPTLVQPTFIVDYPAAMSPLAKRKPDDPRFVERFEGYSGGVEIANSFSELNDPLDQLERFREQERWRQQFQDVEADRLDEDFLTALKHGMPPTGGLGIGVDRLVMLLSGQASIRETILFPQLRALEASPADAERP